jgi:hypothetical protein
MSIGFCSDCTEITFSGRLFILISQRANGDENYFGANAHDIASLLTNFQIDVSG